MNLFYNKTSDVGIFKRNAEGIPGGKDLKFPCAIVDVGVDANGDYETLTEYLCFDLVVYTYVEIRLATRSKTFDNATITKMENVLR
jgi:hypothetical protein